MEVDVRKTVPAIGCDFKPNQYVITAPALEPTTGLNYAVSGTGETARRKRRPLMGRRGGSWLCRKWVEFRLVVPWLYERLMVRPQRRQESVVTD